MLLVASNQKLFKSCLNSFMDYFYIFYRLMSKCKDYVLIKTII